MKSIFMLITAFMIVLSGSGKEQSRVSSNVKEQQPVQQSEREAVFYNEDIDQAKKMAQQYIAILTEFHGRSVFSAKDEEMVLHEMSIKIKETISVHERSYIYPERGAKSGDDHKLELNASRFGLLLDEAKEVYYPNLNVSELIIPMTYVTPGKYSPKTYKLHFVKNNDEEVQLIYDGFFVGGSNLGKKAQDDVDPRNPEKLKEDLGIR
ncbi:hypothetical protein Q5741_20420 [Paenibacillus sp. JX-17]|uniref:Uncharacterized protein n=1 Tax=Paenibacillus lacisoli TaxID=3064525 RepID=A0ABT9CJN9_9BACL|nr:hypothetical protein [Paenibacillus sp. JX-17]MDO7908753.1 hypothetical protein [Paenibacillus sp. JX-17]